MLQNKIFLILFTVIPALLFQPNAQAQLTNKLKHNSIRACYISDFPWPSPRILQTCKDNAYNYVIVEFNLNWTDGAPATPHPLNPDPTKPLNKQPISAFAEIIRNVFEVTDAYGLRVIPLVQIGSGHAYQWDKVARTPVGPFSIPEFPSIEMTEVKNCRKAGNETHCSTIGMPSFAADPNGIDAAFKEYLQVLKEAHRQSKVNYPLELVNLGYDESVFGNKLLVAGAENGAAIGTGNGSNVGEVTTVRYSALDRNFIASYSGTRSQAYAALINQSIVRRTKIIKSVIEPFTKVLVYGDMFDPELNGGYAFKDYSGNSVLLGTPLRNLDGLTESEKTFFRRNVIFAMWSWEYRNMDANGGEYGTATTFQEMVNSGFKFIYQAQNAQPATDPAPSNKNSCMIGGGITGCDPTMIAQTNAYYNACKADFSSSCLGFAAVPFVGAGGPTWAEGAHPAHSTISYLGMLNAGDLPGSDYHDALITNKIIKLLLLDK